jgi:hypothetical protein
MRIDGTHGVDPSGLPASSRASARPSGTAGQAQAAQNAAAGCDAKSLSLDQVRQVLEAADQSVERIAQAKELLASGQLDTPEAVRRAAQALAKFGI